MSHELIFKCLYRDIGIQGHLVKDTFENDLVIAIQMQKLNIIQ